MYEMLSYQGHNKVNQRLRHDETSTDPAWPKVPFPTQQECNSCVRQVDSQGDAIDYDDEQTYEYLKSYYDPQNIIVKKSTAHRQENARWLFIISLIFPMFLPLFG